MMVAMTRDGVRPPGATGWPAGLDAAERTARVCRRLTRMRRYNWIRMGVRGLALGGALAAGCSKDPPNAAPAATAPTAPAPAAPATPAPAAAAPTPAPSAPAPATEPVEQPTPSADPAPAAGSSADPAAPAKPGHHRRHHHKAVVDPATGAVKGS